MFGSQARPGMRGHNSLNLGFGDEDLDEADDLAEVVAAQEAASKPTLRQRWDAATPVVKLAVAAGGGYLLWKLLK